jgi:hypothetical protein
MHRQGKRMPPVECQPPDLAILVCWTKRRRRVPDPILNTSWPGDSGARFPEIIRGVWQDTVADGAATAERRGSRKEIKDALFTGRG